MLNLIGPIDPRVLASITSQMKAKTLRDLQVGDAVVRNLGGVDMPLKVTEVTATEIHCGDWIFSRKTGGEIDPELGWDEQTTGSRIRPTFGRSEPEQP